MASIKVRNWGILLDTLQTFDLGDQNLNGRACFALLKKCSLKLLILCRYYEGKIVSSERLAHLLTLFALVTKNIHRMFRVGGEGS